MRPVQHRSLLGSTYTPGAVLQRCTRPSSVRTYPQSAVFPQTPTTYKTPRHNFVHSHTSSKTAANFLNQNHSQEQQSHTQRHRLMGNSASGGGGGGSKGGKKGAKGGSSSQSQSASYRFKTIQDKYRSIDQVQAALRFVARTAQCHAPGSSTMHTVHVSPCWPAHTLCIPHLLQGSWP